MLLRAAVVALKNGKELTTNVTAYNWRAGLHPETLAFFLLCVETYFVMKCAAPNHAKYPDGEPYAPPAGLARARPRHVGNNGFTVSEQDCVFNLYL